MSQVQRWLTHHYHAIIGKVIGHIFLGNRCSQSKFNSINPPFQKKKETIGLKQNIQHAQFNQHVKLNTNKITSNHYLYWYMQRVSNSHSIIGTTQGQDRVAKKSNLLKHCEKGYKVKLFSALYQICASFYFIFFYNLLSGFSLSLPVKFISDMYIILIFFHNLSFYLPVKF